MIASDGSHSYLKPHVEARMEHPELHFLDAEMKIAMGLRRLRDGRLRGKKEDGGVCHYKPGLARYTFIVTNIASSGWM